MQRGKTAFWAAALGSALVVSAAGPARAYDPVTDPSKACAYLGELVGNRDTGRVVDTMIDMSRGGMNRPQAALAVGQIDALSEMFGRFRLVDLMAERIYGERVSRYWYVLLFENQPAYLHCQFVKPDDTWQLVDFDFNTDLDKVPIP